MEEKENVSIKEAVDELLNTSLLKGVAKRNTEEFAQNLAMWLVRYVLVTSSMNESLKISLEEILVDLHGDKFQKILEVTEKTFSILKDNEECGKYIW